LFAQFDFCLGEKSANSGGRNSEEAKLNCIIIGGIALCQERPGVKRATRDDYEQLVPIGCTVRRQQAGQQTAQ